MTPERWREVGELFKVAVRIDPAGREPWLRAACGEDDELHDEVGRLLAQDERADRDGLLTPPGAAGPPLDRTGSWPTRVGARPPQESGPLAPDGDASADDAGGFTPREARLAVSPSARCMWRTDTSDALGAVGSYSPKPVSTRIRSRPVSTTNGLFWAWITGGMKFAFNTGASSASEALLAKIGPTGICNP